MKEPSIPVFATTAAPIFSAAATVHADSVGPVVGCWLEQQPADATLASPKATGGASVDRSRKPQDRNPGRGRYLSQSGRLQHVTNLAQNLPFFVTKTVSSAVALSPSFTTENALTANTVGTVGGNNLDHNIQRGLEYESGT